MPACPQARLRREALALGRLSHPNGVAVYEIGEAQGQTFVAMELVAGVTLQAWLRERPRSAAEIVAAYVQAGRGLAAAHAVGLVRHKFLARNPGSTCTNSTSGLVIPHGASFGQKGAATAGGDGPRTNVSATVANSPSCTPTRRHVPHRCCMSPRCSQSKIEISSHPDVVTGIPQGLRPRAGRTRTTIGQGDERLARPLLPKAVRRGVAWRIDPDGPGAGSGTR